MALLGLNQILYTFISMKLNSETIPVFVTTQECNLVVEQICNLFCAAGMQTLRTFDLSTTLPANDSCMCRMVVLLVYRKEGPPFSLSIYGEPNHTTVRLQDNHYYTEMASSLLSGVLCGNA